MVITDSVTSTFDSGVLRAGLLNASVGTQKNTIAQSFDVVMTFEAAVELEDTCSMCSIFEAALLRECEPANTRTPYITLHAPWNGQKVPVRGTEVQFSFNAFTSSIRIMNVAFRTLSPQFYWMVFRLCL